MRLTSDTAQVTTPTEREIRTERILDAPRDLVWQTFTEPGLISEWWGRGNPVDVEQMDVEPGGHWRFIEHAPDGDEGFEGRYREVTPPERLVETFEWDGMPGHPSVSTVTFEALADDRTRVVTVNQFMTAEERDGMLATGMEDGLNQSYVALDRLLASLE